MCILLKFRAVCVIEAYTCMSKSDYKLKHQYRQQKSNHY